MIAPLRATDDRRGAAATEYALLLALVAGGVLLAAGALSHAQREALEPLTGTVASAARSGGNTSSKALRGSSGARPADEGWQQALRYADHRLGLVLVLGGVGGLGYSLYRRARKPKAASEPPEEAPLQPGPTQSTVFEKRQHILRVLSKQERLSADSIKIGHIMTPDVVRVAPTATAAELRELMKIHHLRHALVCDARGTLLGVISDRDLALRTGKRAKELMTAHPVTVGPEHLIVPSITWMINQHISCLPVVEDHQLVGVVTTTDLLLTLQCALQLLEQADGGLLATAGTEAEFPAR